jgi:hypothetical protein
MTAYETHVEVSADVLYLFKLSLRIGDRVATGQAALRIDGLSPMTLYDYELEAENLFGDRETKVGRFETRPAATIAINEVLATPKLQKGQTDSLGEFIELYNYGSEAVNLSGYTIEVDSKICSIAGKDNPVLLLPAKSFMILVGKKFDRRIFDLPDGSGLFRMSQQTICGNLRNWPLPLIILRDETGRKIDQFLGMAEPKEKGFSVERLNPTEKHGKEQYCYSRADVGPTPLRMNGITEKGCE